MVRTLRSVAALALFAGLACSTNASAAETSAAVPAVNAEALVLAKGIVDEAYPPLRRQELVETLMRTMLSQMTNGMPPALMSDPGLKSILTGYLQSIPEILRPATTALIPRQMDAIAQAYTRMFSLPELKDIAAFAKTPSGRAYLQRSTGITSDPAVAEVNTQYFAEAQKLTQASSIALAQQVSDYLKAHPDVAKSLSSQYAVAPAK